MTHIATRVAQSIPTSNPIRGASNTLKKNHEARPKPIINEMRHPQNIFILGRVRRNLFTSNWLYAIKINSPPFGDTGRNTRIRFDKKFIAQVTCSNF